MGHIMNYNILQILLLFTIRTGCNTFALSHEATEPTFHSAHSMLIYDRPRNRPARRGDDMGTIAPSRYMKYRDHPYEQVRIVREEREETRRRQKQRGLGDEKDDKNDENRTEKSYDREILRILQNGDEYQPLRIHFDTTDLDGWSLQSAETAQKVDYLRTYVLPRLGRTWSSALTVIPVIGSLKVDYNYCPFANPATSPSFQPQGVGNTDLVIYVSANSDFCSQSATKVLASAFSCFWDQFERPIAGMIEFCLDAIELGVDHPIVTGARNQDGGAASLSPEADKALQLHVSTAVHEIGHVLGITSSDMLYYWDSMSGLPRTPEPQEKEVTCVTGEKKVMKAPDETTLREKYSKRKVRYFEVTTPTVRQVVRNQFNCQTLTGAPLENQPTNDDCFGSHFEERFFFTESLSAVLLGVPEVLSSLTLGLLHDSGWYKPVYSVAAVSPFGHGAGCDFVEETCIVDGNLPSYSSGSFCNTEYTIANGQFLGSIGCDSTHTSMGICDLVDYETMSSAYKSPPLEFQYYPGKPTLGALTDRADYCPTFSIDSVTCQELPGRLEKMLLPQLDYFATSAESSGENSKCFNTDQARPICLEAECDEANYALNVRVAGREFTCDSSGGKHVIPLTDVTFYCPDLKMICPNMACPANCAGHGVCDFSSDRPKCNCFDKTDPTPGCFQSFTYMPPKSDDMNQNSAFSWVTRHKDRGLRLSLLLLGTVWLL